MNQETSQLRKQNISAIFSSDIVRDDPWAMMENHFLDEGRSIQRGFTASDDWELPI